MFCRFIRPSAARSAPTYNAALPTAYDNNNNAQPTYYYSGTPVIAVTTTVTQPVFPSQSGMIGKKCLGWGGEMRINAFLNFSY
jgi:hypothetical protein